MNIKIAKMTDYTTLRTWIAYQDAKAMVQELQAMYWKLSDQVFEGGEDNLMAELQATGDAYEKAIKADLKAFETYCKETKEAKEQDLLIEADAVSEPEELLEAA